MIVACTSFVCIPNKDRNFVFSLSLLFLHIEFIVPVLLLQFQHYDDYDDDDTRRKPQIISLYRIFSHFVKALVSFSTTDTH